VGSTVARATLLFLPSSNKSLDASGKGSDERGTMNLVVRVQRSSFILVFSAAASTQTFDRLKIRNVLPGENRKMERRAWVRVYLFF
jgi:hypothetical protein